MCSRWRPLVCQQTHRPQDAAMVCPVDDQDTPVTTRRCLLVEEEVAFMSADESDWYGDR
jgi:hypothetical protein